MAATLRDLGIRPDKVLRFSTPPFRVAYSAMARLLSLNPSLYSDIQIYNYDHTLPMLKVLVQKTQQFIRRIKSKNSGAFLADFSGSKSHLGSDSQSPLASDSVAEGAAFFDQLVRIMADLTEENSVSIQSVTNYPGLLYEILRILKEAKLDMTSLHSFEAGEGYRFRIGLARRSSSPEVKNALKKLENDPVIGKHIRIPNPVTDANFI